ncbi:MAG: ribonuclease P protein component [Lentimonas sp.]|jgi:ribonuclease P protein component
MGIPTSKRLRKPREFQEVRNEGKRILCGPFIFQCRQIDSVTGSRRLGVVASRRVGNAVKRNLGKRTFRELFRLHEQALPLGSDVVIVLRSSFDRHSFSDLESRYLRACATITKEAQANQLVDQ